MKTLRPVVTYGFLFLALSALSVFGAEPAKDAGDKIRVLVVTGGHDFEKEPFFQVFKDNPEITFQAVEHPTAHALLKPDAAKQYDVLVLYDLYQEITEQAKADLVARLKEGKGLVVLHHAIASYQQWPEYAKIIGGRYYLQKTLVDGVEKAPSTYHHDVDFTIQVPGGDHPVTRGIKPFKIHDETYGLLEVAKDSQPLLSTDEPQSSPVIGWAKTYEAARVVYLESGHDHVAYQNPNFRQLLQQAIRWTAGKAK